MCLSDTTLLSSSTTEPSTPLTEFTESALAPVEQRVVAAVDDLEMIGCLSELLKIPSISGTPEENDAQVWFEKRMREAGLETDLWDIPLETTMAQPDFPGSEVARKAALGLVGTFGHDIGGPTLVLNGHIDVVPGGDLTQWHAGDGGPWSGRVRDGAVYGRGACDMKGGLVASLYAIRAIRDAGIRLRGKVLLESVVAEEDGGLGTFATLLRGYRGDAAIIPEPTNLAIIPACAGALTFRLRMRGRSAHASVRDQGVSTIEKFWLVWSALGELEKRRNEKKDPLFARYAIPYPLSVGTLQAGNWPSSVPDDLVAEGRIGVALGETIGDARQDLEETIARVSAADPWLKANPVTIEWFGGQFASGHIASDHPLVAQSASVHADLFGGEQAKVHGAPYGSDLRLMTRLGNIPTLHYGPGDVRHAHAPNEHVPIDQMRAVARFLALSIVRFCGVENSAAK